MSKKNNLYLGKSGQFAIMAEFLNIGSVSKDKNLMIHISFEGKAVTCSNVDFSSFIDNFSEFPPIEH